MLDDSVLTILNLLGMLVLCVGVVYVIYWIVDLIYLRWKLCRLKRQYIERLYYERLIKRHSPLVDPRYWYDME